MLKHMHSLNQIPKYLDKRIFQKIFNIAEMGRLSPEQQFLYESYLQRKADYESVMEYAKDRAKEQGLEEGLEEGLEKGLEQGLEKGLEKGLEQGLEKGLEQGLEKGKYEMSLAIAGKMKEEGFNLVKIAGFTGLSIEEIESL